MPRARSVPGAQLSGPPAHAWRQQISSSCLQSSVNGQCACVSDCDSVCRPQMALLVLKETQDREEEAKTFTHRSLPLVRCLRTQRSLKAVERVRDSCARHVLLQPTELIGGGRESPHMLICSTPQNRNCITHLGRPKLIFHTHQIRSACTHTTNTLTVKASLEKIPRPGLGACLASFFHHRIA
jgi:hypothetical protein